MRRAVLIVSACISVEQGYISVSLCRKFNESGAISELSFEKCKTQQYLIEDLYFLWLGGKAQVHGSSSWCSDTWA